MKISKSDVRSYNRACEERMAAPKSENQPSFFARLKDPEHPRFVRAKGESVQTARRVVKP